MTTVTRLLRRANPQKSPQYSLRLYCTPSTYYTPTQGPLGSGATEGLPVEFPPTSEIRVNNYLIAASLKGVKKKIGSCPPANLHKAKIYGERMIDLNPSGRSSVELIHINQSQNTAGPKVRWAEPGLVSPQSADDPFPRSCSSPTTFRSA